MGSRNMIDTECTGKHFSVGSSHVPTHPSAWFNNPLRSLKGYRLADTMSRLFRVDVWRGIELLTHE